MKKKELFDLFTQAVEPGLEARGFRRKRRSPAEYVVEIAREVSGHLEWSDSFRGGVLELSPMIGVRHRKIEKELGALGFFADGLSAWKAAGYLGEPGHYRVEQITGPDDAPAAAAGVFRQLDTAMPAMFGRCASESGLLVYLDQEGYGNAMARARRAVILQRLGREREAREFLVGEIERLTTSPTAGHQVVALKRVLERFG